MEDNTEIVQLPALFRNGEIVALRLEWKDLDNQKLRLLAMGVGGTLGYVKMRATYTPLEVEMCNHFDCNALASAPGTYDCGRHG